jgi:hypothetical protein
METKICRILIVAAFAVAVCEASVAQVTLPGHYFKLMEAGIARVESRLKEEPNIEIPAIEQKPDFRHFAAAILMPSVVYKKANPDNKHYGDAKRLALAKKLGDLLATEHEKGRFEDRPLHGWDTYMWLESYRILEKDLEPARHDRWKKALLENLALLYHKLDIRKDYPWYKAPFIITSPNHYSIYASTVLLGGVVFNRPEWLELSKRVLHRFSTIEQSEDGYWGEFDNAGPTTGYDYLTFTQIALYWEYSKDSAAYHAMRRSTDFHEFYTYPDGTPVETINDRNRHWEASRWGHFGFSNFPDGRRYAEFLTGFVPADGGDWVGLGRIAQDALYYHEGTKTDIPQDKDSYFNRMKVPAGIRKTEGWVVCLSGLLGSPDNTNNFFLDRQGNMSVFHEKCGLIITGANSKDQPQLATFTEDIGTQIVHKAQTTHLSMGDRADKLSLSYNVFFAELEIPKPSKNELKLHVATTYKWGEAVANMNLQLVLKAGQVLQTGGGKTITLDDHPIKLTSQDLGGSIRHNGWTMQVPPDMELTWPVFPYNPYASGPETSLENAVGRLSIPLWVGMKEKGNQVFDFSIKVE